MKTKLIPTLMLLALGLFSLTAHALPKAFSATYAVSKSGLSLGEMRLDLSYNKQNYYYKKSSKAHGLAKLLSGDKMVENVQGLFQGNYLQPQSYLFHHTSKRKNRKDQIQFTSPQQAVGQYKKDAFKLTIPKGTLDRASLELALARDVSTNKTQLNYNVIERGKIKTYHIKKAGNKLLNHDGKQYHVQKMIVSHANKKRSTVFWLAKELDYMPIRIDHTEKDKTIVTQLKRFKFK